MKKCSGVWRQRTVDTLNGWYLILVLEWDLVLPNTYSDFAPNAFPASGEEKNGSWLLIRICESVFLLIWNANYNFFKSWTLCGTSQWIYASVYGDPGLWIALDLCLSADFLDSNHTECMRGKKTHMSGQVWSRWYYASTTMRNWLRSIWIAVSPLLSFGYKEIFGCGLRLGVLEHMMCRAHQRPI